MTPDRWSMASSHPKVRHLVGIESWDTPLCGLVYTRKPVFGADYGWSEGADYHRLGIDLPLCGRCMRRAHYWQIVWGIR